MMEHVKFAAKVLLVVVVAYQIAPVRNAVFKSYFGS